MDKKAGYRLSRYVVICLAMVMLFVLAQSATASFADELDVSEPSLVAEASETSEGLVTETSAIPEVETSEQLDVEIPAQLDVETPVQPEATPVQALNETSALFSPFAPLTQQAEDQWLGEAASLNLSSGEALEPALSTQATVSLSAKGQRWQSEARKLLAMVNEARAQKGAAALQWDSDLEACAMQRAAECALLYSHTRPDSTRCFTAWPANAGTYYAENIAAGYRSAQAVNTGWTNSEGHYANMINSNLRSFAAAAFISSNGTIFWAECFGNGATSGMIGTADDSETAVDMQVDSSQLTLKLQGSRVEYDSTFELKVTGFVGEEDWYTGVELGVDELNWSSLNSSIVSNASQGKLRASGLGVTSVSCSPKGSSTPSAAAEVEVYGDLAKASIASVADVTYTGSAINPRPQVRLGSLVLTEGVDYQISYSNNINAGTATISFSSLGYCEGSNATTFTIVPRDISDAVVSKIQDRTYNGSAHKPQPSISVDGLSLSNNKDFTLAYSSNTDAGTATVTVTGKGNYTGTTSATFKIKPANIASASVSASNQTYTGAALRPAPTVKLGSTTLKSGTDYTISYSSNINVGTATIVVSGKGNYTGKASGSFKINPASIAKAAISGLKNVTYTGKAFKPAPTVKLGSTTLVSGTDYTVSYKNNVNAGTATVTVTGKGNYTASASATFKINPASLAKAAISGLKDVTYTGKAFKPAPTVKLGSTTLKANTDYTVSYKNNVNAGTATVTVTGKGNYTGTTSATFKIKPVNLASLSFDAIADQKYTSDPITPKPQAKLNDMTLVSGTDFEASYQNNVKCGEASITITGIGNYSGSTTLSFKIVPDPVAMYRLYNPNSGEHFYTASAYERDVLKRAGWRYEGIGWYAPRKSKTAVYRLYNPNAGDHHYTMSAAERDALIKVGWRDEGIGWYSDDDKGVALYRQYNPNARAGSHNYTVSKAENDMLVSVGWRAEGIGWYGLKL